MNNRDAYATDTRGFDNTKRTLNERGPLLLKQREDAKASGNPVPPWGGTHDGGAYRRKGYDA